MFRRRKASPSFDLLTAQGRVGSRKIAGRIKRSISSVAMFIQHGQKYGTLSSTGCPPL